MNVLHAKLIGRAGALGIDVELETKDGPLVLVGPNGAGKTSVLRMLLGVLRPEGGCVTVDGVVLFDASAAIDVALEVRGLGYVPQGYGLFPHMTVAENIEFALGSRACAPDGRAKRDGARASLAALGIEPLADRRTTALSGGEKQRVALARAIAVKPRALLLDEPLAALDIAARREVRTFLADYLASLAVPTVVVTHDPADARALGHRIAVLEAGRIVQRGTWAELEAEPASPFIAELVRAPS